MSNGKGLISSSYFEARFGLGLGLDDLLVGALDPESDSELEVLNPDALDPVLEMVFVLPLDWMAWRPLVSTICLSNCWSDFKRVLERVKTERMG